MQLCYLIIIEKRG